MAWIYFAFSAAVLFAILNILQREIAVDSVHPRAMSVVFNIWGAILAITISAALGAFKNFVLPPAGVAWVFMLFAALMYGLFERGRFLAAKLLDASVLTIITDLSLVIAFIGSTILYSEPLTTNKIIGAGLVLISLVLVSTVKSHHKKISLKGIGVAILISIFLGLGWMLDKKGVIYFTPGVYNVFVWVVPLIIIYFPYIKVKDLVHEAKASSWKIIVLAGINVVGYILQLKALESAEASRVTPIVQLSTLMTVIFGIAILRERDNIWRKIIAAGLGLTGAFLLAATH